eukprot:TRINITY_DN80868_c0_g1_i1.p1 TRINITY_DN80868_c0_g1~~TRINITY_DN80868_c0_g1_i1.p1  ORF type:complete len:479 (+),score=118.87 TRINITY_DN80868_c0_g1_i1:188-1438(+)
MQEPQRVGMTPAVVGNVPQPAPAGGGKKAKKAKDDEDQNYTTVMLRNIPNKYSRHMLMEEITKKGFLGDIDYMYLPTDFTNRCNVGYCFCNFRTAAARQRFQKAFDGVAAQTCLPGFNSYKVCQVTRAKWQGRAENVKRLRSSPELMQQLANHPEWLPLLMDARGQQEPFPHDDEIFSGGAGKSGSKKQRSKRSGAAATDKPATAVNPAAQLSALAGLPGAGFPGMMGQMSPEAWAVALQQQQQALVAAGLAGFAGGCLPGFANASASGAAMARGRGAKAQGAARGGAAAGRGRGGGAKLIPGGLASHLNPPSSAAKAFASMPMMGTMPGMMGDQSMQYMTQFDNSYEGSGYFMPNPYAQMGSEDFYVSPQTGASAAAGSFGPCGYMGGYWDPSMQAGGIEDEGDDDDEDDDEEEA